MLCLTCRRSRPASLSPATLHGGAAAAVAWTFSSSGPDTGPRQIDFLILAWGCHAGAVRFCGMLSNCRSIRLSPKAGTSSAPLQESGALFDFAAVPDLPACLRPPRPLCLSAHGFVGVFCFVCVFCVCLFVRHIACLFVCVRVWWSACVCDIDLLSLSGHWAVAGQSRAVAP